jgi:hypothetical protein
VLGMGMEVTVRSVQRDHRARKIEAVVAVNSPLEL